MEEFPNVEELFLAVDVGDPDAVGTGDFRGARVYSPSILLSVSVSSADSTVAFLIRPLGCNGKQFLDVEELFLAADFREAYPIYAIDFRKEGSSNSSMSLSTTDSTAGFLIVPRCCNGEEFLDVEELFLAADFREAYPICAIDF
jgi:hypothetical protein